MCPTPADISIYRTDEELFMFFDKMLRGSPFPSNVITDINPYHIELENLSDGTWYFIGVEDRKNAETGFWKVRGEPCHIFSNPTFDGWRTTLEFHEGKAPHGFKTDWLMQEYKIVQKRPCDNELKGSSSFCRVFLSDEQTRSHKKHILTAAGSALGGHIYEVQEIESNSGLVVTGRSHSQVKLNDDSTLLAEIESHLVHPVANLPENSHLSEGDYLELQDLRSTSFSSADSSCASMSSDECFDSLVLLQELDAEIDRGLQQKDAGSKFNVLASHHPAELVLCPATSGSLCNSNGNGNGNTSKSVANEGTKASYALPREVLIHGTKSEDPDSRNEGPSASSHSSTSSSGNYKGSTRLEVKKRRMKYLCFFPF